MKHRCRKIEFPPFSCLVMLLILLAATLALRGQTYEDAILSASDRQRDDQLGRSVATSGSRALVGAPFDDDNGTDSGSAYIFRYDSQSETWIEEAKLLPSDGISEDYFGWSVCLSGDVALVGAPQTPGMPYGSLPGSAYIFRYDPATAAWIEEAKLVPTGMPNGDGFGLAVSLDGDAAAVGAPYRDLMGGLSGSAFLFRYDSLSETWIEESEIVAPDGEYGDRFGYALVLRGDRVVVGAPLWDEGTRPEVGALYEFEFDPGSGQWSNTSQFYSSEVEVYAELGFSLAMSGDTVVAGAPFDVLSNNGRGSVHIFRRDETGTWSETASIQGSAGNDSEAFGLSVDIDGEVILVGAMWSLNEVTSEETGAGFKYRYNSVTGTWILEDKLLDSYGLAWLHLGFDVALCGEAALLAAPIWSPPGTTLSWGAVLVYGTPDDEPVIRVPSDFPTIQEAIDAAPGTWTILVDPGTYVENIDFKGKSITLRSTEGPEKTKIDGSQAGSVVTFSSPAREGAWLDGFTVTNGSAYDGGGIHCDADWTIITGNIVTDNNASYGGGIYCHGSDPIVFGNALYLNEAGVDGGGILFRYVTGDSSLISHNWILANATDGSAGHNGGGIHFSECIAQVVNNLIVGNSADEGGGVYFDFGMNVVVTNNTIYGNTAVSRGGGISFGPEEPTGAMTNSIVWDNSAPSWPEIDMGLAGGSVQVTCCDVKGGWTGTGNIDADPLFADAALWDFHLTWDSPCREAGSSAAPGLPDTDIEGDPRSAFAEVDMGADEFYTHLYHVGAVAPGSTVEIKVVGLEALSVMLFLGSQLVDPPSPTQHGSYHLDWPPLWRGQIGTIPSTGVLVSSVTIPMGWSSGEDFFTQALVGPWNGPQTLFTNPDVLFVE